MHFPSAKQGTSGGGSVLGSSAAPQGRLHEAAAVMLGTALSQLGGWQQAQVANPT